MYTLYKLDVLYPLLQYLQFSLPTMHGTVYIHTDSNICDAYKFLISCVNFSCCDLTKLVSLYMCTHCRCVLCKAGLAKKCWYTLWTLLLTGIAIPLFTLSLVSADFVYVYIFVHTVHVHECSASRKPRTNIVQL